MRDKSLVVSLVLTLFAASFVAACGGDDDDGATPTADAAPVSTPDAMVNTTPDAGIPVVSAADLGKPCTMNTECAAGICLFLEQTATSGFCSIQCGSGQSGDQNLCGPANGFPGPGSGRCALSLTDGRNVCAVTCTDAALDCPTGLTCKDLFNAQTMMAGQDGMKELCAP